MQAGDSITARPTAENQALSIWDSQYESSSKAFDYYREEVSRIYLPWSPQRSQDAEFQARIATVPVGNGFISRHRCIPHVSVRSARDIAVSDRECSYLLLILGGQLSSARDDCLAIAQSGDIVLFDSTRPTELKLEGDFDALVVTIPKTDLRGGHQSDAYACNMLLAEQRTPLPRCLDLMADVMASASAEEMAAHYDAVISLLPIEAGCFANGRASDDGQKSSINILLRNILAFIDQDIANGDLTPQQVADEFDISVRYVHKLFIESGTTFRSYTTARRLENVCNDLVAPTSWRQPISAVAFRWGFNDLSSFNRAFKNRFACTPSQFRNRAGY
jgi:AraC family transcriptional regulator, positive regulator of tynA and feaB